MPSLAQEVAEAKGWLMEILLENARTDVVRPRKNQKDSTQDHAIRKLLQSATRAAR